MRISLIIAALVFGFVTPAFATNCPNDIKAIQTAQKTATLNPEDKTKVEKWLKNGEEQHKAGKHKKSLETLAKAKAKLGLQ